MRRGFLLATALAALAGLSPLHAQYYYPPSPYGPIPGYGYPPAMMQPYGPNPMYVQPVQFAPRPPVNYQTTTSPRVYDFGPLSTNDNGEQTIIVSPGVPVTSSVTPPTSTPTTTVVTPDVAPAQPGPRSTLTKLFKPIGHGGHAGHPKQEGCGPQGCPPGGCGDAGSGGCDVCAPLRPMPRPHPRGHCFLDIGAFFLMPTSSDRNAYTITSGGTTTATNFPHDVLFAPRFSLGYVCHNGWGVRANYWFTQGNVSTTATNSVSTTILATPTALPFQISSPGATLAAGVGSDQFTFTQAVEMQIGALEFINEFTVFDMVYLAGIGARYGQITQKYSANRINAGGVGNDREDLNFQSRYEGIGPTLSFDGVCPIFHSCLSLYGNVRGTALFGIQRFNQDYALERNPTAPGVVAANTTNSSSTSDNRTVYALEVELGFQVGKRIGPCYWFSRTGAVAQRWWDVGSPLSNRGDLSFLGGTFQVGVTY